MRLALALLLGLFLGQALVYPAAAALEVCAEACPDDAPDGSCDPTCADCTCCGHAARPFALFASTPAPLPSLGREPAFAIRAIAPGAEPADVFHVPRPLA